MTQTIVLEIHWKVKDHPMNSFLALIITKQEINTTLTFINEHVYYQMHN